MGRNRAGCGRICTLTYSSVSRSDGHVHGGDAGDGTKCEHLCSLERGMEGENFTVVKNTSFLAGVSFGWALRLIVHPIGL